jgi:hypothetical protein
MKGAIDQTELDTLCADILGDRFSLGIENYKLPSTDLQRSIIIIKNFY